MRANLDIDNKKGLGIAFDIGTTTVAGALVDLFERKTLKTGTLPNPQARWGRDVVSRINAVVNDPSILGELRDCIIVACNGMIRALASGREEDIREMVIAGNPVMEHLFLGVSPEPLSRVPYKPAFKTARTLVSNEAGLVPGDIPLYAFPLIGGFVGGDAVAVALSSRLRDEGEPALAIDIGTNSEILLSCDNTLYAASAAAGPAFEGGGIRHGMVASRGAIQGFSVEDDAVRLDVIGPAPPSGICGSGLIEAVSALLKAGIIESSGRIRDRDEVANNLSSRIRADEGGNSFILYRGAKHEVILTQGDIRALQVAKAATRAGISMLLKKAGITAGDVKKVFIAGAFGSHLNKEGLKAIGVLEKSWDDLRFVGDAALEGAVLALLDDRGKREAEDIASKTKYISLSGSAHFEREFIREMNF